jgi:hypothetical protein
MHGLTLFSDALYVRASVKIWDFLPIEGKTRRNCIGGRHGAHATVSGADVANKRRLKRLLENEIAAFRLS